MTDDLIARIRAAIDDQLLDNAFAKMYWRFARPLPDCRNDVRDLVVPAIARLLEDETATLRARIAAAQAHMEKLQELPGYWSAAECEALSDAMDALGLPTVQPQGAK